MSGCRPWLSTRRNASLASQALGDLRYEAYALRAIGLCHAELGDDEAAIEWLSRARLIDVKRDDPGYAGYDLFLIGQAELRLDRPLDGIKTLETGPALAVAPRLTATTRPTLAWS